MFTPFLVAASSPPQKPGPRPVGAARTLCIVRYGFVPLVVHRHGSLPPFTGLW
jgi:hypothetical protein